MDILQATTACADTVLFRAAGRQVDGTASLVYSHKDAHGRTPGVPTPSDEASQ